MLAFFNGCNLWVRCAFGSVCVVSIACPPLYAQETDDYAQQIYQHFDHLEYLDYDELIDFIIHCKYFLISKGYEFPPIIDILKHYQIQAQDIGIYISDETLETLHDEFIRKDFLMKAGCANIYQAKHKKHHKKEKHKKELHATPKMICGFLKFIAGGLCCIIPIPIVQGAGAALAVNGVNDMVDSAREEGQKKDLPYIAGYTTDLNPK